MDRYAVTMRRGNRQVIFVHDLQAIEFRHVARARGRIWTSSNLTGAALSLPPALGARHCT
ncbi:MAG TPA: hypothetical protein VNY27_10995 [Solirubrobacteraceae bacterium]|nr:hypothetical protein [Solirubrobacteraceae bacterium]